MLNDVLDLLDIWGAGLNGLLGTLDYFVGEGFSAVGLELFCSEASLSNRFDDFLWIKVDDFTVTLDDFFEHMKYTSFKCISVIHVYYFAYDPRYSVCFRLYAAICSEVNSFYVKYVNFTTFIFRH